MIKIAAISYLVAICFSFLPICSALSNDFGQHLLGEVQEDIIVNDNKKNNHKKGSNKDYFIPDTGNHYSTEKLYGEEKPKHTILGTTSEHEEKLFYEDLQKRDQEKDEKFKSPFVYTGKSKDEFYSYSKSEITEHLKNPKHALALSFYKDTFDYQNDKNNFKKTFRDSPESDLALMLQLSYHRYFNSKSMNSIKWGLGTNIGLARNSGRAYFQDGVISENIKLSLWLIPVDFSLLVDVPLGGFFDLSIEGGPSATGLIFNRSDFESDDKRKLLTQFGFGYFAQLGLGINIGRLFFDDLVRMNRGMQVTKFLLKFSLRYNDYESFKQKDIKISGNSLGLGFQFDYN